MGWRYSADLTYEVTHLVTYVTASGFHSQKIECADAGIANGHVVIVTPEWVYDSFSRAVETGKKRREAATQKLTAIEIQNKNRAEEMRFNTLHRANLANLAGRNYKAILVNPATAC
jgi:hypothetical protein